MRKDQDSAVEALVEQLIEGGSENMATVFAGLFNLAMRIERERFLAPATMSARPSGGDTPTAPDPRRSTPRPVR